MSNSTTTKKTQNSLWLLRRAFSCIPCIHPALCIFLWSNVFLGSLKPLKPLEPLESLSALSALHKPLRLTAPPARRGRRAQFRPPLPTSPIVGEGYLGEEWSDGTGNEFVIRNKNAPQAPQLTHLWWLLVALARHRRCLFCVDVRSALFRAFGCQQAPSALAYSQLSQFNNRRPRPSGTPSNLEGDVHGAVHTISTTPPSLPYRRGGVLGGATKA